MSAPASASFLGRLLQRLGVAAGAALLTVAFFLVLPLMQAIAKPASADLTLQVVETAELPPPPPPPEEEPPEEEPEPEAPPPDLPEEAPPLTLEDLELALNPGAGSLATGDLAARLELLAPPAPIGDDPGSLTSLADLDRPPRAIYRPSPVLDAELRKRTPATVHVLFLVDESGRVANPIVEKSTDPAFDRAVLAAVKQWRFEPVQRAGKPVSFRMRIPITFPRKS